MTESEFLQKFDDPDERFGDDELERAVLDFEVIERVVYETERWTQPHEIFLKVGDRYFSILAHYGLTSRQDCETCYDQPREMNPPETVIVKKNKWTYK